MFSNTAIKNVLGVAVLALALTACNKKEETTQAPAVEAPAAEVVATETPAVEVIATETPAVEVIETEVIAPEVIATEVPVAEKPAS